MKTHHSCGRIAALLSASLLALLMLPLSSITPAAQAAPATISGTVYQDYNGNGRMDDKTSAATSGQNGTIYTAAIDTGVAGVAVTAYDATGQVASATISASNGTYTLTGVDSAQPYRVEFSGFKEKGYESGANGNLTNTNPITSETSIQFAMGGATAIDFGVNVIADFCQNNPSIVVNCMRPFDQTAGPFINKPNLFLFPYGSGGTSTAANVALYSPTTNNFDAPKPGEIVRVQDIGTTLGIAYNRQAKRVYSAAFMKRHAGFGAGADGIANNSDDARTVYIVDPATTNTVAGYVVVPGAGTNPHDTNDYLRDNISAAGVGTAWASIGKTALGGVAVSSDGTQLFAMNLESRTLYAFSLDAAGLPSPATPVRWQTVPGVTAIPGSAASANAPTTAGGAICPEADMRAFAVHYERDSLYVGMVCSAQTSQNKNDLTGYIYQVDPATLVFNATPVFRLALNYTRGQANHGGSPGIADWNPWTDGYANVAGNGNPDKLFIYPQPMLTDITFDRGNLIIGLRDRAGDQSGNVTLANPGDIGNTYRAIAAGEVLRACVNTTGGWDLESNGQCGSTGSTAQLQTNFGARGPGTGPFGGEFYYRDEYGYNGTFQSTDNVANYGSLPFGPTSENHDEVSVGNVVQVPGFPDVVAGVYDPITTREPSVYNDGGMRWWSNTNGDLKKLYRLYLGAGDINSGEANFGKANGLGGVVVLCDTAPVEIGNRIWFDANRNGVQDPGEPVIPGVTLNLYRPGATIGVDTPVGSATTDANGNYLFSGDMRGYATTGNNGSASGGFAQNGQGGAASTASARYGIAALNTSAGTFQIQIDTTQPVLAGLTLTKPTADARANGTSRDSNAVPNGTNAIISFAVGRAGENNHTLDAGFYSTYSLGNRVWFDKNDNGAIDAGEVGAAGVRVNLFAADASGAPVGAALASVVTDSGGYYRFDNLVAGTYIVQVDAANFATGATLKGYRSSTPTTTEANPNNNRDSDDNGLGNSIPANTAVTSNPITIGAGSGLGGGTNEPTGAQDGDRPSAYGTGSTTGTDASDNRSNLTVDFGFYTNPTAITMLGFSATRTNSGVAVRWTTAQEANTLGFHVYRSATGQRADATRVSAERIAPRGNRGSGASYAWIDASAAANTSYTYWIEETDLDGTISVYGPARSTALLSMRVFLPMTTGP